MATWLLRLEFALAPAWPLSLLADEALTRQVSAALTWHLQLSWARRAVLSQRLASWRDRRRGGGRRNCAAPKAGDDTQAAAGRARPAPAFLALELEHFVRSVAAHSASRRAGVDAWLRQRVARAASLEEAAAARGAAVAAAEAACLPGGGPLGEVLRDATLGVVSCALQYAALAHAQRLAEPGPGYVAENPQSEEDSPHDDLAAPICAALDALESEARARLRALFRLLGLRAAEPGAHVDTLRTLLSGLDFNCYYERQLAHA